MNQPKKTIWIVLSLVLLVCVIAAVCIGRQVVPTVNHALRITELLQPVIDADNKTMHLSLSARIDSEPVSLETDIYTVTENDTPYLVLEQQGVALYIMDNLLLLENGKAFRLGENLQPQTASYADLLPKIGALYGALSITAEETEDSTVYAVTVTGEQVAALLEATSLADSFPASAIQSLRLTLTEKNGNLSQICFSGSGDLEGTAVSLDVTISGFRILAPGDYPIPEAVKTSASTVDPAGLFSLTEDLYRLILAFAPLADMDAIDGTLSVSVDCSLLQLNKQMRLSDLQSASSGQIDPEQLRALPEALVWLCMEGDITCTQTGTGYVYTLALDQQAMGQLSQMILPELAQYSITLSQGTVTILLDSGTITTMAVSIKGSVHALIVQLPVTVSAEFSFD